MSAIRTRLVKLLDELVVLATQLGPFGKLVLAARGVELTADLEVVGLEDSLLAGGLGGRDREEVDERP